MRQTAGKIMPLPRGAYDENTEYGILDIVTYDNKLWICKKSGTTGITPTKTAAEWMMCVDGTTDVSALETESQAKIDGYDSKLEEISGNISTTNTSIQSIQTNIAELTESTNTVTTSVSSLDERCSALESKPSVETESVPTKDSEKAITSGGIYNIFHGATDYNDNTFDITTDAYEGLACDVLGVLSYVGGEGHPRQNGYAKISDSYTDMYNKYESDLYKMRSRLFLSSSVGASLEYESWENNTPKYCSGINMYNGEVRLRAGIGSYSSSGNMGITPKNNLVYNGSSLIDPSATCFLGVQPYPFRSIYASNIYLNGSAITTSDRNEKKDIVDITEDTAKDLIMGLNPVTYKFVDGTSDRTHYGLIAQDVENLLELLGIDNKDFAGLIKSPKLDEDQKQIDNEYIYGLRYDEFIAPLIKMCQNLQNEVTDLRSEIETLKNK